MRERTLYTIGGLVGIAAGVWLFGWDSTAAALAVATCIVFAPAIGRRMERLIARRLP